MGKCQSRSCPRRSSSSGCTDSLPEILRPYTAGTELRVDVEGLRQFLKLEQGEDGERAEAWIAERSSDGALPRLDLLLLDEAANAILDAQAAAREDPRDRALSDYFISASHNTYLSGNQLTSSASVEALSHALRMGVRVIELDVSDGAKGSPIVKHGGAQRAARVVG